MSRTSFGAGLAAALLLSAAPIAQQNDNVLVIVADDLGVDVVGAYGEGGSPPPTPSIDGLARRGVLFRNTWANPSCSPTRASLMTGRYPFRTLVGRWIRYPNNSEPIGTLSAREWTLPELIDRAGAPYAHACIGKWHINDVTEGLRTPNDRGGFAHFVGHMWGQIPSYYSWPRVAGGVERTSTTYATTQQTDDALAWIGGQTGPWVCYVTYTAPHLPFERPPAHLFTQNLGSNPTRTQLYKAIIESLDTEIGRLLNGLGAARLARTNVMFLGDNGSVQNTAEPPFNGSRAKGTPYEGGLNVPLIAAGPAVQSGGRQVDALTCAVDVFATALELTGADSALPPWVRTDGVSVVPYLQNPTQAPLRQFAYAEEFRGATWPQPNLNGHACVRDDRYKLIHRYSGGSDQLYDLVNDPWERTNILARTLTQAERQRHAALLNEIARLRGQTAQHVLFGTGSCVGSNGVPQIAASAPPRIGNRYDVQLTSAAASRPAALLFGLSSTRWQGLDLPLDLTTVGGGVGCALSSSGEAVLGVTTTATGTASLRIDVPATAALVDHVVFQSWVVVDPTAPGNALGAVTTNALASLLGN